METHAPATAEEAAKLVAWAAAEGQPLEIRGAGSKRGLGRPVQAARTLAVERIAGIIDHDPAELVLTARAGTPLAEIETALDAANQQLAFEPPDWGALLGAGRGRQTLGGVIACNLSGPRRISAGAARDHFLGFQAVNGRGEVFKGGGRVVKNVTGYDLPKLMAGSMGTLAVLTEVTVKVLPRPEKVRTVLLFGLDDARAAAAMAAGLKSAHEVSAAAHLPAQAASRLAIDHLEPGKAVTAIRVEGVGPSVEARCAALRTELASFGTVEELHSLNSRAFWQAVRDASPLVGSPVVWRLSVPPMDGPKVAAHLPTALRLYDWGGGLLWLGLPDASDAHAPLVRRALATAASGHATLLRAPDSARLAAAPFEPMAGAAASLAKRVKDSFDPAGVLNPGRMAAGV
ncbi:MAG: glycolate oxidase subunit GlcE [Alphaproteobacteria bacterium]|nr:glycolate oxidase subunit GlcE [Alphaproteobacteria bacterium]